MSFDVNMFKQLPLELQVKILIEELDLKTLKNLCSTDTYFRSLCLNEILWRQLFDKLSNMLGIEKESAFELTESEKSWLDKTQMLWVLTHPRKGITITSEIFSGPRIIASYLVVDQKTAITCLIRDYNRQLDPVYTKLKGYMQNILGRYQSLRYTTGDITTSIQTLTEVVNGTQPLDLTIFISELMRRATDTFNIRGMSFTQSFLFDFRNGDESIGLYRSMGFYADLSFLVSGNDWELFGKVMNLFLKQNITLFKSIEVSGNYSRDLIEDFKDGKFNILTGTIRECSTFSSLVPAGVPLPGPIPSHIADRRKGLSPLRRNIPLPPPGYISPVPPSTLRDRRSFPPPKDWQDRLRDS